MTILSNIYYKTSESWIFWWLKLIELEQLKDRIKILYIFFLYWLQNWCHCASFSVTMCYLFHVPPMSISKTRLSALWSVCGPIPCVFYMCVCWQLPTSSILWLTMSCGGFDSTSAEVASFGLLSLVEAYISHCGTAFCNPWWDFAWLWGTVDIQVLLPPVSLDQPQVQLPNNCWSVDQLQTLHRAPWCPLPGVYSRQGTRAIAAGRMELLLWGSGLVHLLTRVVFKVHFLLKTLSHLQKNIQALLAERGRELTHIFVWRNAVHC